jgi:tRNA A37 threonylcarbamoyladenosine synthetase subunit TsaC/SUA5/YrdC
MNAPAIWNSDHLAEAAAALRAGHVIAVPTPRWYMLCAAADNPAACRAIFTAKRRPAEKPLLLVLGRPGDTERLCQANAEARALIDGLWPGELALRLPWRDMRTRAAYPAIGDPALVQCAGGVLGRLARRAGPIAAASLSISTPSAADDDRPALTLDEAGAFITATGAPVVGIIDGGICPHARHLTIVDCLTARDAGPGAHIIREGTVHPRAITAALTTCLPDGDDHHVG